VALATPPGGEGCLTWIKPRFGLGCSLGPYLELFARRKRPGWDVWGNEVTCDVAL
jgi:hypothetical protein